MAPEIWSVTNRIFCHFGQFFALLPPNNPKNQNFEKLKNTSGDIIILHMCTIKDNHMMYGSWDMEHDRQSFVILDNLFPFYSPKNQDQNFEKMKKNAWICYHFTQIMIICYTVPEIWCMTDVIIFHFGLFFALLPPNLHEKRKFQKNNKKNPTWRYHHSTSVPKIMMRWCTVPEIWYVTDRHRQTKKVTRRGGCPT